MQESKHASRRLHFTDGPMLRGAGLALALALGAGPALGEVNRPVGTAPHPRASLGTVKSALGVSAEEGARPSIWVTFGFFFTHLSHLDAAADEEAALGRTAEAAGLRTHEQRSAGLSDDEAAILKSVARDCRRALREHDRKLLSMVEVLEGFDHRSRRDVPSSTELDRLWADRTDILLAAIDTLRFRLGDRTFDRLEAYIDDAFRPSIRTVRRPARTSQGAAVPYIHVYAHTTLTVPHTAISECGAQMTDGLTAGLYPSAVAICAFWHATPSGDWTVVGEYSCYGNPAADCRTIPFSTISGHYYTTTGVEGLNLRATPECINGCGKPYWDPLWYSVPAGTPFPYFINDGDVFSKGSPICACGNVQQIGIAETESTARLAGPVIRVTPSQVDFGEVPVNATLDGELYVQNVGQDTLVGTATTTAPFSIVSGGSYSLPATQSQTVVVRFAPKAVGPFSATITFTGGGGDTRTATGTGIILRNLNVAASGASTAVSIAATPVDYDLKTGGTTPFGLRYRDGTAVTLTAPSTSGTTTFTNWTGCTTSSGTTCHVTLGANNDNVVVTAVYGPAARSLGVYSSPAAGVAITVSPADRNNRGNGTTVFMRLYDLNKVVTLGAPAISGYTFSGWVGCDGVNGASCTVTMSADRNVTAAYAVIPARTLTISSSNPASGVALTVSPNDRNGQGNGTTPFTRSFNNGTNVTLTAPATSGTNTFVSWSGCDASPAATCTVMMNADKTVTANYAPPRTLTVSTSPTVAVTVSPNDRAGLGNGTSPFTRSYTNGTVVTLTVPATAPDGSNSPAWTGCDSGSGTTCTVTMNASRTVTAIYRMPIILVSRINGPTRVVGPRPSSGTVTISAAAPAGGATVSLSSSLPAVASVPASVLVPAGATVSQTFTITTATVTVSTLVTITATYQGSSTSAGFYVDPIPYEGYLDGADCSTIWGWGWDASLPNTPINVDLYDGTTFLATVAANAFRQDLLNAGKGNGYHAFNWTVPQSLKNGVAHSIRAKFGGTQSLLTGSPRSITCAPPSVSVAWVKPSEVSFGPPGTLTVAGYAQNGTGGVTMRWRDMTTGGAWNTVAYAPVPDAAHVWYNTIPNSNNCHTYQVQGVYSGVTSSTFTYTGLTSGYCSETARVIWIQPQTTAGFGPPGSLIVAGSAQNAPSGTGVKLFWKDVTAGGTWNQVSYAPAPDASHTWYNSFPANFAHTYKVYIVYDAVSTSTSPCTYAGNNTINSCP